MRGPARKGITTVQRAGRDAPHARNTSNHNNLPSTLPVLPVCALGVEAGTQHAAPLPPPDPTCTCTSGEKLVGTPGHSSPGTAVPFHPDLPLLVVNCFAHLPQHSPSSSLSPSLLLRDRISRPGAQQCRTSPPFPAVPLCGLPCMVIVITADPTLLETMDGATRNHRWSHSVFDFVKPASGCGGGTGKEAERRGRWFPYGGYVYVVVETTRCVGAGARLGGRREGV